MGQNVTTLGRLITHVRLQVGLSSQSEPPSNPLSNVELTDMVHLAIVTIRSIFGDAINQHYRSLFDLGNMTITTGVGTAEFPTTANVVFDTNRISLWHAAAGAIPIYAKNVFDDLKSMYAYTELATSDAIATIYDDAGTLASVTNPPARKFEFWSGASSLNNVRATMLRDPIKAILAAAQLDAPEQIVPLVIDMVVLNVYKRIGKQPPVDVHDRVTRVIALSLRKDKKLPLSVEGV